MSADEPIEVNRRAVLVSAGLIGVVGALGVEFYRLASLGPVVASWDFLPALANHVIPATATAGAGELPEVIQFVNRALPAGLYGGTDSTLRDLERLLDRKAGGSGFAKADPRKQAALLTALDRDTFSRPPPPPPEATQSLAPNSGPDRITAPAEPEENRLWRIIKEAIVVGYYTSEEGASKELTYQLVPGRFDPDVPLGSVPYLSNYWLENVF